MTEIWVWTIVIVISIIIELFTMQLVPIWLALAGAVGLVLALVGGVSLTIQIIVVAVLAILLILLLRPFALKFLHKNKDTKSVDSLVGKKSKMLEKVTSQKNGSIKVNGIIWSVTADEEIERGTEVEVVEVNGNKLKVKKGDN